MKNIEKKAQPDFKRENDYAGEELRIAEILKTKMSEEEVARVIFEIEKIARGTDEVIKKILSNPKVIEEYDVSAYDGFELHPKPPARLPLHFIKDGLWELKNLNKNNLFALIFFNEDESYNSDKLLKWLRENLEFNRLRLHQLEETGDLMVTDPTKVRIRKVEIGSENDDKDEKDEEDKKPTIH